ncbi:hypothetical protein LTR56_002347 [Elasticomyces elasticus]|nr:hypothetical protein LTR56_002347 [Elasticomyces elasticus]KAK3665911.1 hypothetical protein LTR22_003230 [Elasticomyces elasticus]KAK4929383.1 hypothetical protein LTR49_003987 [Elasticomyces elasticus]KAK5764672.1 hypothetical protein LTS12_005173 [Elasticomyces elasticus]
MPSKQAVEERLQACINTILREEYPNTHTSDINAVATDAAMRASNGIVKKKKARKGGVRPLQFLELPAEIRNCIYEFALKFRNEHTEDSIKMGGLLSNDHKDARQPAITMISRQVREDTLAMYYGINRFVVELRQSLLETGVGKMAFKANAWLGAIGERHGEKIKDITIAYRRRDLSALGTSIEREMAETNLRFVAKVAKLDGNMK